MRKYLLALAGALALAAMPAQADSDFGVKVGQLSLENDSSAATMAGIVYSWDLAGMVGAEADLMISVADGEIGPADYSAMTAGAYAVVMTPGPFYVKGKAGIAYNKADAGVFGSESGAEMAYGIGFGFFGFELEFVRTKVDVADVNLMTLSFKF